MFVQIAFLTGLLGSMHCMGMCGPIAMALPVVGHTNGEKIFGRVLYNFGRLFTYSLLGFLLGSFGWGLKLAGIQQGVSITAGGLIVLTGIFSTAWLEKKIGNPFSLLRGNVIQKLFQLRSMRALFLIGLLNGLLPCGFVYVGLIGSVATQSALQGSLFMFFFGLGTFPLMFGVSIFGQFVSVKTRGIFRKLTPVFAILIGCIFILRGMNLGIPYLSPKLSSDHKHVKNCHRK
jgi:sulfite exporter TauE/SafE